MVHYESTVMLPLKYCFKIIFQRMGREYSDKQHRHRAFALGTDTLIGKTDNKKMNKADRQFQMHRRKNGMKW